MKTHRVRLSSVLVAFAAVALVGCDDGAGPQGNDSGIVQADAGVMPMPDAGYDPDSCDFPEPVTLDFDTPFHYAFDTSTVTTRPRDLGFYCGNESPALRWAKQKVVEITVPGTGPASIAFSTVNDATDRTFNTVIQVRRGACRAIPSEFFPVTCFDDVSSREPRTSGAVFAQGGDTLYFFVTGYSEPPPIAMQHDEGPGEVVFTLTHNTPPTLVSATFQYAGDDCVVTVNGRDDEAPIQGYAITMQTPSGRVDADTPGPAGDTLIFNFDTTTAPPGPEYMGYHRILGSQLRVAAVCRQVGCIGVDMQIFDRGWAASPVMRIPITR